MDSTAPISVSELTAQIKNLLEGSFQKVWITGEISNFTHHRSGHMYFTLKDEQAEIRSIMFKGNNQFLRFYPEEGMKVVAQGRISVFEKRGSYQLTIGKMEPAGLGELYLTYEALKKQLSQEGLFDQQWKKPLPTFPKQIGVITSGTGAAIQDIIQVLNRRAPYVSVVTRPTQVQGEKAAKDIIQAISEFEKLNNVDLLIIGRGGGSLEDLWPFNEEITARAIYNCSIPVISAVGHETDITIADLVADLRAPTPSAAAEVAAPHIDDLTDKCITFNKDLNRAIGVRLEQYWQSLDMQSNIMNLLHPGMKIEQNQSTLQILSHQLNHAWKNLIQKEKTALSAYQEQLEILNPKAVLERGYSIAYTKDREIIRSADSVDIGSSFDLQTADGRLTAVKTENEEN